MGHITDPKCTDTDLKKSQICPIWGQGDPIWMPNLPSLASTEVNGRVGDNDLTVHALM